MKFVHGSMREMRSARGRSLVIGSINTAGQAATWARAVRRHTDATAVSWQAEGITGTSHLKFPVDETIPSRDLTRLGFVRRLLALGFSASHVLLESGRTFVVRGSKRATLLSALVLRALGTRPAFVFHGSDIRIPSMFRDTHPEGLFSDPQEPRTITLEGRTRAMHRFLRRWPFPVFVSTPDLLRYVPSARWLPLVPEDVWFDPMAPIEVNRTRPRVLHLPSSRTTNNSDAIENTLSRLAGEGLVDFRSLAGVPPAEVRSHVGWADLVVDKIGLGGYGVMATQVLASGRILIGDVDEVVRAAAPELPIVQVSVNTLEQAVRDLVSDRSSWSARAAAGKLFARKYHDGRYSASVLAKWMGVPSVRA